MTFVWALFAPKGKLQEKLSERLEAQRDIPDITLEGAIFSESAGGTKYWEIDTKSSRVNQESGLAHLENLQGLFFDKNKPVLYFQAPSAEWLMKTKKIAIRSATGFEVSGPATLRPRRIDQSPAALTFETSELLWSLDAERLRSPNGVVIKRGPMTITAGKLDANVSLAQVLLTENPKATMGKDAALTADRFELASREKVLSASGRVEFRRADMRLQSNTLRYDEPAEILDAAGNIRGQKGDLVLASGAARYTLPQRTLILRDNVVAFYQNIEARGDVAVFDEKANTLRVTGHVLTRRDGDALTGDTATVWLTSKKIEVKGRSQVQIDEP